MRTLIVASLVSLLSLAGCGAELPAQEADVVSQEVTAQSARCVPEATCRDAPYCLGRCTGTGSDLHLVAYKPTCGTCQRLVDAYCKRLRLGDIAHSCWGWP